MLTATEINRAIRTATTERVLVDTSDGRGAGSLRLRIRPTSTGATAVWVAAWKVGGKRSAKPLGRWPDMTIAAAREAYRAEIAPALLAGKDPRVKVAAAGKPTVERMFEGYVAHMRALGRESANEVERVLLICERNAADALGRHRLAGTVEPADVVAFVVQYFDRGHRGAADKARSYVHSAFAWAMQSSNDYTSPTRQDWGVKANPAAAVKRDSEATGTRDRNLSEAEIRTLWHAAGGRGVTLEVGAAIRLLLATGQRIQELLRVDGAEIDLDGAAWHMPIHKTKAKLASHTVPLTPQAVEAFRELVELHGDGPLFPARKGSKKPRIGYQSVNRAIQRWSAGGAVKPLQCRDLRRTWKSRAAEAGIDKHTRDLIQQHARGDTSGKHYDRADYAPVMREAMDRWGAWLDRCLSTD